MSRSKRRKLVAPLAVRDGVSASRLWLGEGDWPNMLAFLVARFPAVSEADWAARMKKMEVVDLHGTPLQPDSPYRRGTCIFYYRELVHETPIPFAETILYQDEHILVADKPHFLPVIPTGRFVRETLLARLRDKTGLQDLTPIHRLDRETAGVVLFSHNGATRGIYQSMFQKRAMEKVYEALAPSKPELTFPLIRRSRMVDGEPFICMTEVDGEPNSETQIEVVENRGVLSLYRLRPVTGKKHQLRLHMAALGMPILNDAFYPVALPCKGDDYSQPLQLLAREIAFTDPLTGTLRRFTSERKLEA
jgi:tRNA pseudouridine32 synthase/23S rRNA pseudouridine746 synthase